MVLHALHLCSGYAGFELGLRLAGVDARTVAHVERDSYAAATLVARMEDQALDRAPIWSDLSTFDGAAWRGRVDLITAGLPCQPFSGAGLQLGRDDGRHLWPMAERVIADVGPRYVMLENVPDVVLPKHRWLEHVLCSLAALGFDAEWGVLSAADVGAPHQRDRFWLLGYTRSERRPADPGSVQGGQGGQGEVRSNGSHIADGPVEDVGHAEGVDGVHGGRFSFEQPEQWGRRARVDVEEVADPVGARREIAGVGQPESAWPPPRDDRDSWARWTAAGGPEPSVRRSVDGRPPGLADALHLGGNGLVPTVAALAFLELAKRAGVSVADSYKAVTR